MSLGVQPIDLDRVVCFRDTSPLAVPLETTLPGQLVLVTLRAGQSLPEHRAGTPALLHVVRGEGAITVCGTTYPATAGMLFSLSAQDAHRVAAKRDLVLLVYHARHVSPVLVVPEEHLLFSEAAPLTLDVRPLTPRDRARRMFATVDALLPREALRLVTDRDPHPLLAVLAATHPGGVVCEPERDGPDEWIVRITKLSPSPAEP